MKPLRATTFLIAFVALILLATGTRNISAWRGLIQPTVAADSSNMTAIAIDPPLTPQGNLEYDTNRPGADYRNFEPAQADPAICRNECANDSTCRAFTYVKPGVQGPKARCWLKSDVPNASANNCCVSGVKSGGSSSSGLEVNVNRRGGDYRDYDLPSNNPSQCRDDCMNDSRCQSFTFLRPSYWGPNAHCFLKNSVPNATQETCCISGVKAGGGGGGGEAGGSSGKYLGCWKDQADQRDIGGDSFQGDGMTTERCVAYCSGKGYAVAGTQYSSQCFCGNTYGKYGQASNCNMKCSGNSGQTCGGSYANSVYRAK